MRIKSRDLESYLGLIDGYFAEQKAAAAALARQVLDRYGAARFVAGRTLRMSFSDGVTRELRVLISEAAATRAPRIALADGSKFLVWPHVEKDGVLCLLSDEQDLVAIDDPIGVLQDVLQRAVSLIEDCLHGRIPDDFRSEANSYWGQRESSGAKLSLSLVEAHGPTRQIAVWPETTLSLFAENADVAHRWISNRYHGENFKPTIQDSVLLWLPSPLMPAQFPQSAADMEALADLAGGSKLLHQAVRDGNRRVHLLLGADTPAGPFLGAVSVAPHAVSLGPGKQSRPQQNGFRPGRQAPASIQTRFFGPQPVVRSSVERAEAKWVHGRAQDDRVERLVQKRVAIVGCGSVGSSVAVLLAQAGVGGFVFVDPQSLTTANTARHALGYQYIRRNKAASMADHLSRRFPHLISAKEYKKGWERLSAEELASVFGADLVICAIGSNASELSFNALHRERGKESTIMYAWLEARAVAGHALVIPKQGACFRCGFDPAGHVRLTATEWTHGTTLKREPACAEAFQPYGAVDMQPAVAMMAETALDVLLAEEPRTLHAVSVLPAAKIIEHGGRWSAAWTDATGREDGGFVHRANWPQDPDCPERHDI